jgi:hypothetical protein
VTEKKFSQMEYRSFTGYDRQGAMAFVREAEAEGFDLYDINMSRTSSFTSLALKRRMPLDANGFTDADSERADETQALKAHLHLELTGEFVTFKAYNDVQYYLHQRGWIKDEGGITEAGKIALASQEVQV